MPEHGSQFVPLTEAAVTVYRAATGARTSDEEILTAVAASIAKHSQLYAHEGWGPELQAIRDDVMETAVFYQGGEMMRSRNTPYTGICMQRRHLPEVIELVAPLYRPKE